MIIRNIDSRRLTVGILSLVLIVIIGSILIGSYNEDFMDDVKTKYKYHSNKFFYGENFVESDHRPPPPPPHHPHPPKPPSQDIKDVKKVSDFKSDDKIVLFPKHFPADESSLSSCYYESFNTLEKNKNLHIFKYNNQNKYSDSLDFVDLDVGNFHKHTFQTFNSYQDFSGDRNCAALEDKFDVEVTKMRPMDDDLEYILKRFIISDSEYFKEIEPYFKDEIQKQLQQKTINKHWYKLAGTSVWLEQYGVHYMISRVIYSPAGVRNQPIFSLTYAQIFDENWRELENIELIIPTNNPDSIHDQIEFDGVPFTRMKYPTFLSIPTLHDPTKTHNLYYGAEDPRILLVKGESGYEEPLIVFNAYHRKIVKTDILNDDEVTLKYDSYRSMFLSWPWKFQRGKRNVDELPNSSTDDIVYNKVIELRRNGLPRQKTQKNWTPFVDFKDRETFTYDKFIYFVYRWSNFEVLKCELTGATGDFSKCEFEYKMVKDLDGGAPVGQLRGGTEMININSMLKDLSMDSQIKLMQDKQIWIGFARAHIKDCGCGPDMYRPNLVVIVKDDITNKFKVDILSSFASLDIPVLGWDLDKPDEACANGPSVFIPNGISSWSIKDFDEQSRQFNDYLTLSFSLSDATNDLVQIKGVLSSILNIIKPSKTGFNNDNVECALDASRKFCHDFGEEVKNKGS